MISLLLHTAVNWTHHSVRRAGVPQRFGSMQHARQGAAVPVRLYNREHNHSVRGSLLMLTGSGMLVIKGNSNVCTSNVHVRNTN